MFDEPQQTGAVITESSSDAALASWGFQLSSWLQQQLSSFGGEQHTAGAFSTINGASSGLPEVDTSNTLPLLLPAGPPGDTGSGHQSLVTVGNRQWGNWWDGRGLLKVKIYDFAIYADAREARAALAGAFSAAAAGGAGASGGGWRQRRQRRRAARAAERQADAAAEAPCPVGGAQRAGDQGVAAGAAEGGGNALQPWWQPLQQSLAWWPQLQDAAALGPAAPEADAHHQQQQQHGTRRPRRLRLRRVRKPAAPGGAAHLETFAAGDACGPHDQQGVDPRLAALPDALKASGSGVSLLLRAARDIPLAQLREEYEKILKRRLSRVGGDPSDPALGQLLDCFSDPRRLPPSAVAGGSAVRRGASIVFTRRGPVVEARVGHHHLGSVTSNHLAEALLDLYLGDLPVSGRAKAGAADTLARIAAAADDGGAAREFYRPRASERLRCSGDEADAGGCVVVL